ncbi:retrovirus-related pol polyprotein from transposon TNT 1-94 [Tanacetum coccineum]|uniref:Retrovirus-related pol polyprotein from transposon TNT 1-94 n=1 Tax=Tanacetum coccineum TaxID=301880 RepID=A0ABQ5AFL1_9ASTR
MKIPNWMITNEMKLTDNYKMTTSTPKTPNPAVDERESSAQQKSTVIRLYIIQLSIVEQKSRDDLEAKQNVKKIKEHLIAEDIEKLVEGTKNIKENKVDNIILDNQNEPGTRLESRSYKESIDVEITTALQLVNVNEEEEESAEDAYELKRREKGRINVNHVKDFDLASLIGKLKYEENLIDSIYKTEKSKSLVFATPLSTAFISTSIVQDFQYSPDDEDDTRSSQEYLNDIEEEYQARAFLAKSKRFFKKGTQRFSSAKATDQTKCHKCGKKGHFARDCWSKDEEKVSSDDNEVTKVKALMALADEERVLNKETISCQKHRNLVQELNTCKEQLLVLKQAKLDLLTMQHVNIEILKKNQNLRNELIDLTSIKEAWLNSSNKFNQCISEQIPTEKKKILGIDQLTENTSSSVPKDLIFIKYSADILNVSINVSDKSKLSEAEDSTLSNHSANESSVCSTQLPSLKKLDGVEPISGPKTIKSILKSKSTFKAKTLKDIIITDPSSAPARSNKSCSASKTNLAPAGKLKNVNLEDDPPLAIIMKELNELKLQLSKNKSSYFRNKNTQQCKRTDHRTCDHAEFMSSMNINQYHTCQGESSSRSRPSRPAIPFPSCIHFGYNDHKSDDCVNYPICEICGSYDHDTHDHNRIISLIRGIKPRNPQHIIKKTKTCGSNVHTTSDHNDIKWFRKRVALQAKKAESFKASKTESLSALRSKTPTKRLHAQIWEAPGPKEMYGDDSTYTPEGHGHFDVVFKKGT